MSIQEISSTNARAAISGTKATGYKVSGIHGEGSWGYRWYPQLDETFKDRRKAVKYARDVTRNWFAKDYWQA